MNVRVILLRWLSSWRQREQPRGFRVRPSRDLFAKPEPLRASVPMVLPAPQPMTPEETRQHEATMRQLRMLVADNSVTQTLEKTTAIVARSVGEQIGQIRSRKPVSDITIPPLGEAVITQPTARHLRFRIAAKLASLMVDAARLPEDVAQKRGIDWERMKAIMLGDAQATVQELFALAEELGGQLAVRVGVRGNATIDRLMEMSDQGLLNVDVDVLPRKP